MAFRLPKRCDTIFKDLIDNGNDLKLKLKFDAYYLSLLVGLANKQIIVNPEYASSELVGEYPKEYFEYRDYIAGLLISTEAERLIGELVDSAELESLIKSLIKSDSPTRLTNEGEKRLNQYAAKGSEIIHEKMMKHEFLDDFYLDYFGCFKENRFIEEV